MFDDFFLALSMLSRIRTPRIKRIDYGKSVIFFPAVGYIASGLVFLIYYLSSYFMSDLLSKALSFGVYYLIFGFFHFDGLLDVIDGFMASHKDREKTIKIMKEPTIGAFALLFGFLFLLLELVSVMHAEYGWIFFPIYGRASVLLMMEFSKPCSDKGLGALFGKIKVYQFILGMCTLLPLIYYWETLIAGFISMLISFTVLKIASNKKLGGFNGDVLGATVMLTEMLFLIGMNIVL